MVKLLLVSPGPPNRIRVEHAPLVTTFSSLRGWLPASGYSMRTAILRFRLVFETWQSSCFFQLWHASSSPVSPTFPVTLPPLFLGGGLGSKRWRGKMWASAGTALCNEFWLLKGQVSLVLPKGWGGLCTCCPPVLACSTVGTQHLMGCTGLREGLRFRSLCLSGAASLSRPPLPPVGTCFSFFQPGVPGVEEEGVEGVEEAEEVAVVVSLEPCVWQPRWWPWLYLEWLLAPILKGWVLVSDLFCSEGQRIFPERAFGLWSLHQRKGVACEDAPSFSSQSYCLSLIVSAAAWLSGFCSHDPGSSLWTGSWCSCTSCAPHTGLLQFHGAWTFSSVVSWLLGDKKRNSGTSNNAQLWYK